MSIGWIKRIAAGAVLAACFFAMPFTDLGKEEPWYFWIASGLVAFVVAILLLWIWSESQKDAKRKKSDESAPTMET